MFSTPNLTVRAAAVEDLITGSVYTREGHGTTKGCKGVVLGMPMSLMLYKFVKM